MVVFFFQAEDGIRDGRVTGVQTCALPISPSARSSGNDRAVRSARGSTRSSTGSARAPSTSSSVRARAPDSPARDRKSTRLNSSHPSISYAVFCLKKKKNIQKKAPTEAVYL